MSSTYKPTKVLFLPGDVVTIRQAINNKPQMIVVKKVVKRVRMGSIDSELFQGMLCR